MKNKLNSHHFNMIEISFALLVIAIGVTTIFGLIPIGSLAHAQAVNQNQAADAAENALNRLSAEVQRSSNWTTMIVDKEITDDHMDFSHMEAGPTSPDNPLASPDFLKPTNWVHVDTNSDISSDESGLYKYQSGSGGDLYRFIQVTTLNDGKKVVDFDAIVKVWQSTVASHGYDSGNVDTRQNVIMLNVEISWPALMGFSERHKAYYKMEVFCKSCIAK